MFLWIGDLGFYSSTWVHWGYHMIARRVKYHSCGWYWLVASALQVPFIKLNRLPHSKVVGLEQPPRWEGSMHEHPLKHHLIPHFLRTFYSNGSHSYVTCSSIGRDLLLTDGLKGQESSLTVFHGPL